MKRSAIARKTPLRLKGGDRFPGRRDDKYRAFIREQPCALKVVPDHQCNSPVRCCHLFTRGKGAYDWADIYPGCDNAHNQEGTIGWRGIWDCYGVNLAADCIMYFHRYLEREAGDI